MQVYISTSNNVFFQFYETDKVEKLLFGVVDWGKVKKVNFLLRQLSGVSSVKTTSVVLKFGRLSERLQVNEGHESNILLLTNVIG